MSYHPANPLIVQGDRTVLLEVDNPLHADARGARTASTSAVRFLLAIIVTLPEK